MKNYKLVIFDLDGTLLDTTKGILASIGYTLNRLDLPLLQQDIMLSFIGPPVSDSFAKHYGLSGAVLQKAVEIYRDDYSNNRLFEAKPYAGIYDVFDYLRRNNIKTAIATYKREDYALRLLQYYKFDNYTNIIFGADNDNKLRKKDIIMKCINKAKSSTKEVVVVGDTTHDAMGAESLNVDFIAVTYGFGFKMGENISCIKPVACVDSPLELITWFNS
jgi:phosphoglycolate phosphatase